LPCGGDQAGSGCTGVGLASQQKDYSCIQLMQCIHFMWHEEDQALLLKTTLLSLTCLPATWHTGPKFNASNWLLSVPWPGGWYILLRVRGPATGQVVKGNVFVKIKLHGEVCTEGTEC